ncbi:protein POLLEN DEFECTIVE IN GUIDANCE 1 [Andrographis paniculata]|uniref:protein POLLEN DEFECTIVE IN GUIDANCE 1 n=1 Tax=Andrographis paniculata TaxID=175694 RepID=UPI0021E97A51|nr:protein POLLEN DEFECTIVE IN GUIDANCE 1 [Andrographis paniculata]
MASRSGGGKLSFDVLGGSECDDVLALLSRSNSDPPSPGEDAAVSPARKKRKRRNRKAKTLRNSSVVSVTEIRKSDVTTNGDVSYSCTTSTVTETALAPDVDTGAVCSVILPPQFGELRQRNVGNAMSAGSSVDAVREESGSSRKEEKVKEEMAENRSSGKEIGLELNGRKLEKEGTLDWKKLMAEDPNYMLPVEKSPVKYFFDELSAGNSLRSTTILGNDKERERIYDTIFRLPWRCELLIDIGSFVCFDSFLSLLTIMPSRMIMALWRLLKTRQLQSPSSAELSDFGCFIILVSGVTLLQQADISLIYHMIRGQGILKLYVVYNVLEVFDKLCQSLGSDVMQALFHSADGLANCSPENTQYWLWRFIADEALAIGSSILHSFILLAQAITLSTCIVAHNNALFAMLVSNNFAEIKSNVFKRYSKDNVHNLVHMDSIERFHISAFLVFVLAQNILEAEGPWFVSFFSHALTVFICEMMIDIIKHSFIAKFNDIKPTAFSEFLEDLCNQTLNTQTENGKRKLTFIPLAPACVVIRVLQPVYAAHLPTHPLPWRIFWIMVLLAMTIVMLASLKMMMGMGLKKHANWYVKRCQTRKLHSD